MKKCSNELKKIIFLIVSVWPLKYGVETESLCQKKLLFKLWIQVLYSVFLAKPTLPENRGPVVPQCMVFLAHIEHSKWNWLFAGQKQLNNDSFIWVPTLGTSVFSNKE